jgi:hypothetical protein
MERVNEVLPGCCAFLLWFWWQSINEMHTKIYIPFYVFTSLKIRRSEAHSLIKTFNKSLSVLFTLSGRAETRCESFLHGAVRRLKVPRKLAHGRSMFRVGVNGRTFTRDPWICASLTQSVCSITTYIIHSPVRTKSSLSRSPRHAALRHSTATTAVEPSMATGSVKWNLRLCFKRSEQDGCPLNWSLVNKTDVR